MENVLHGLQEIERNERLVAWRTSLAQPRYQSLLFEDDHSHTPFIEEAASHVGVYIHVFFRPSPTYLETIQSINDENVKGALMESNPFSATKPRETCEFLTSLREDGVLSTSNYLLNRP